MGLSPTEDPELVILVVLYNPTGEGGHQGGECVILSLHFIKYSKRFTMQEKIKQSNQGKVIKVAFSFINNMIQSQLVMYFIKKE